MKHLLILIIVCLIGLAANTARASNNDYQKAGEAYERGDYKTALKLYRDLASLGHAQAQYDLGVIYFTGIGLEAEKNPQKVLGTIRDGIALIAKAAENNNPDALSMVASFYERGLKPYSKDLEKAHA